MLFWCRQGVRLFRVDNPHTKPFPFWEWMIAEVRARYPDAVFLAEAFTRPKVMYRLAKVGFGQSYTYFTWRNASASSSEYLTELTDPAPRDFFRPHFFVNTPDINPVYPADAAAPAFLIRAALAATLSGLWGVYNGFELCEGTPLPGARRVSRQREVPDPRLGLGPARQHRGRDHRAQPHPPRQPGAAHPPGHDVPAGRQRRGAVFVKPTPDRSNVLVVAISLDPAPRAGDRVRAAVVALGPARRAPLAVDDLVGGDASTWRARRRRPPRPDQPYAIWRVSRR